MRVDAASVAKRGSRVTGMLARPKRNVSFWISAQDIRTSKQTDTMKGILIKNGCFSIPESYQDLAHSINGCLTRHTL